MTGGVAGKNRQFSLAEHAETILDLWDRLTKQFYKREDIGLTNELPQKLIFSFLQREGVALDRDKAKSAVESEIGVIEDEEMISYTEFTRIFCRGIFKQALIRSAENFMSKMS